MSKPPLHIAITYQPKTPSVTDTPNRPPLWEVMAEACAQHPDGTADMKPTVIAAMIKALRDHLIPEDPTAPSDPFLFQVWRTEVRLRASLSRAAENAERKACL